MEEQPAPRKPQADLDEPEPQTADQLRDTLGQDVPSDEERAGLGDIGEYGDAAATGQAGAEADSLAEEGLDRFGDGDLGASQPIGAEEHASRVATTGGLDAGEASREGPGTTRDAQTNPRGTG